MSEGIRIGIALSGGGVRAFLFGLGALRAVIAARTAGPTIRHPLRSALSWGGRPGSRWPRRAAAHEGHASDLDERLLGGTQEAAA